MRLFARINEDTLKAHFLTSLQGWQMFIFKNSACIIKSELWPLVLNLD
jgi:hypothetical protein